MVRGELRTRACRTRPQSNCPPLSSPHCTRPWRGMMLVSQRASAEIALGAFSQTVPTISRIAGQVEWQVILYIYIFSFLVSLSFSRPPRKIGVSPQCVCSVSGKPRRSRMKWSELGHTLSKLPVYLCEFSPCSCEGSSRRTYLNGLPPLCPGCSHGLYRWGVFVPSRKPAGHRPDRKYHPGGDKDGTSLLIWLSHEAQL